MPKRRTLKTIADEVIRESRSPLKAEEIIAKIQNRWRRKIAPDTLNDLRRGLEHHQYLIGVESNDYMPYPAVFRELGDFPLSLPLGKMELARRRFLPGHRLIPFISHDLNESDLVFFDPQGRELPKERQTFLIEDVIHYYQYAAGTHFPGDIQINEGAPGKSSITVSVWDLTDMFRDRPCRQGDHFLVRLLDYDNGVFQIQPYPQSQWREDRLRLRSLNVSLENELARLCEENPSFAEAGLEKQLLRGLLALDKTLLPLSAFNISEFLESLNHLALVGREGEGVRLAPMANTLPSQYLCEEAVRMPTGKTGSLKAIFEDLGLAVDAEEFNAILYTIMGSDDYKLESVFDLIFGGEGKLFYDKTQHNAFYTHLRELLFQVCEDLKEPESLLITRLRDNVVRTKLRLIGLLRFLEKNEVGLKDLPLEILEQIVDIDHYCTQTLRELAQRNPMPEITFLRDSRLTLKIIEPHIDKLEEDIYYRLDVY